MSIQEVVDGLFDLPSGRIKTREMRDSWCMVHGRFGGRLFMMVGQVNEHGEWTVVKTVAPVWPPKSELRMAQDAPVGLLPKPVVMFDKEDGHTVSAYMKLRKGVKAVGCVQPNPDALVFFYIAADGFPIGIRFHEPASGVAVCTLVDSLVEGPSGPEGIERSAEHHFFTDAKDLLQFLRALKRAIAGMENHPSAGATQ